MNTVGAKGPASNRVSADVVGPRSGLVGGLHHYSQLDPVVGRIHEILLRAEVSFGRLDRGMAEQQLDLLKLAARRSAELGARPSTMPHAA